MIYETISAVEAHSGDPNLRAAYGNALLAAGHPEAEASYQASLARRVDSSSALYNLAGAFFVLHRCEEASAAYAHACELAPDDP